MIDPTAPRQRADKPEWLVPDWHTQHQEHVDACAAWIQSGRALENLFIGDSITFLWQHAGEREWNRLFKDNSLNVAIGGDSTGHLIWRLQNNPHLCDLNPTRVICLIGTNNIGNDGQQADEVVAGVSAVVDIVKTLFPNSEKHFLHIFPRGRKPDDNLRKVVNQSNELLAPMYEAAGVRSHNCNEIFLDDDLVIPEKIMPDELHLSPSAYALLAPVLLNALR